MPNTGGRRILFLFWLVPALVAALGMELVPLQYNPDLNFLEKFGSQFLGWEAWWPWSLIILAACDRVPFRRGNVAKAFAVHIPLSVVIVIAEILVTSQVSRLYGLGPERGVESIITAGLGWYGDMWIVIYWAIVGAHAAFEWHDAWRAEALVTARLGADLALAQLQALRAQLNPHFLFNALNSVVTLIGRDQQAARRMVVQLSDLLRTTLALSSEQEVPLKQEVDLATRYLEIEEIRFHDRLRVEFRIDNRAALAWVPSLVLQPLVENAVVHGISRVPGPGTIAVDARVSGGSLIMTVLDNGPGPSAPSRSRGAGLGIKNLRARLERLYDSSAELVLSEAPGGGCLATLVMPVRTDERQQLSHGSRR